MTPRPTLVYDYPMENYLAQLVLPRDMTEEESAKLAAFVKTIYLVKRIPAASHRTSEEK